ncbi:LPXTG cell wall anchor domain-containing protein [Bacillus sp. EB600]|uniref:LPXTG cell wall anchor domain-containing protein n=1 Tax=Bacillus sp. EB600 TaxID=2806345 RepID=UPI0021099DB7|nr:LPXTG cell wall anchor domain-containing protein [Bacillus sp. EB600]MCQ6278539.1 LPXTG cell wall anchor domain-containing protein [Bacillus sp. EB600]
MLKKLLFTCLLIYTSTIGFTSANAKAAEPVAPNVQIGGNPAAGEPSDINETSTDLSLLEKETQKQPSSGSTEENIANKAPSVPSEAIQGAENENGQAKTNPENNINNGNAEANMVPSIPTEDIQGAGNESDQAETNPEHKMNEGNAETNKAPSVPAEDIQSSGNASGQAESNPDNNKPSQNQSTDTQVIQNQTVTGGKTTDQNQTANVTICQQQTILASVSCQGNVTSILDGHTDQSKTATIVAAQVQNVDSSANVKSEQTQKTGITSDQKLEIMCPCGETQSPQQGTNILTNQAQSINTSLNAELFQGQLTEVNHSQDQHLETSGGGENGQRQLTNVEELQAQSLSTSGPVKIEQTQTVEVKGSIVNTIKDFVESGVKVTSRNYIEIIKETTTTVANFIQEIFVNNELVDRFTNDYSLEGNDSYHSQQAFQKQYDWGNLNVENLASVQYNEQLQQFETSMSSYLSLVFGMIGNIDCPKPAPNDNNEPPAENNNDDNTSTPPAPPTESGGGDKGNSDVPASDTVQEPTGNSETNTGSGQQATSGQAVQTIAVSVSQDHVQTTVAPVSQDHVQTIAAPVSNNNVQGNSLPNTATNSYNLLVLGLVLITAGGLLYYTVRKKLN